MKLACRFCDAPLDGHVLRPRHVAAGQLLRRRRPPRPGESRSTRCTRTSATSACSCSCRVRVARAHLQRLRSTSRRISSELARARAHRTSTRCVDRFGLRPRPARSSRSPATTAICCSTSRAHGVPVLGIEPAANVAEVAGRAGHRHVGRVLRHRRWPRSCVAERHPGRPARSATTCSAHVPDLNDFVGGHGHRCSRPTASITMEFPHLLPADADNQFDTIYHEHFSYFSFLTVSKRLRPPRAAHLRRRAAADPRRLAADLRLPRRRRRPRRHATASTRCAAAERAAGLDRLDELRGFAEQVRRTQARAAALPASSAKEQGKTVVAYGAPAKGNTLLNYCGVGTDLIDYTVDRSPHKQGTRSPARASRSTRPSGSARPSPTTC